MALIEFQWVAWLELIKNSKYAGLVAAGDAANHPRRAGAFHLGAKVVGADAAGVICGSPRPIFFLSREDL
jgi:hypothetical protein